MLFVRDAATKIDREIIMETKRVEFPRVVFFFYLLKFTIDSRIENFQ